MKRLGEMMMIDNEMHAFWAQDRGHSVATQ